MEILVTRRNDLKGMNSPAAPAAALDSFTAFPKAGFAQDRQRTVEEIVNSPSMHRLNLYGIEVHETGTVNRSRLPNFKRGGHLNWRIFAKRVAARFTARHHFRVKLPLKRARPADAWMWIPRGWKHLGKWPLLPERIIGHLT